MKTMKLFGFIFLLVFQVVVMGCKNARHTQLEQFLDYKIEELELLSNDEGMDEYNGDRYFISVYKISESDKSAIMNRGSFKKLERKEMFDKTKLERYLDPEMDYIYKSIENDDEVNYIILDPESANLIFAKSKSGKRTLFFKS